MGLDFVRKAAPNFHKGIDRSRVALATPALFTRYPGCTPRAYSARVFQDAEPFVGESVGICLRDGEVLVMRGLNAIAVLRQPPTSLLEALTSSFGVGSGTIQEIQTLSKTAEVTIC